jgi:hypothetical protein
MKYSIEMALGGMTYIPNSIKFGLHVRKFLGKGINIREQCELISLLFFFRISEEG